MSSIGTRYQTLQSLTEAALIDAYPDLTNIQVATPAVISVRGARESLIHH